MVDISDEEPEVAEPISPEEVQAPVLGHWDIRGLAQAIRYQLVYSGVEFDDFYHYHVDDQEQTEESWRRKKDKLELPFASLPYFVDNKLKLTGHIAIHQYVADKWMPELLGKTTEQRAMVDMLAGVLSNLREFIDESCHKGELSMADLGNEILERLHATAVRCNGRKYLLGNDLSYMDFYLYELLQLIDYITQGEVYQAYPHLEQYQYRISQLPRLKRYLLSPNFIKAPF